LRKKVESRIAECPIAPGRKCQPAGLDGRKPAAHVFVPANRIVGRGSGQELFCNILQEVDHFEAV
jgi:hypothetical protein